MSIIVRQLKKVFSRHIQDEVLLLLIGNEISPLDAGDIKQHLAVCLKCSARCDLFRNAARHVSIYGDYCVGSELHKLASARNRLEKKLGMLSSHREYFPQEESPRRIGRYLPIGLPKVAFAAAMILSVVSAGGFFSLYHSTSAPVGSSQLLLRAEAWDVVKGKDAPAGVICETVRIKEGNQSVERQIYRDVQGVRTVKLRTLKPEEEQLKAKLMMAGITWDAPLSASTYRSWHDWQRLRKDQIRKADRNLLVLTTTTPEGDIARQSLAVRKEDFRPVARTIAFRDSEEVEIAELDYRILPWEKVNPDLFLPMTSSRVEGQQTIQPGAMVAPPAVLSESQLDETELDVRLILNQMKADTGEQIQVERTASGILVQGLVETDQRRNELVEQLRHLRHVKVSIASIAEVLQHGSADEPSAAESQTVSVSTQQSPLETYYLLQGRDAGALRSVSQQLLQRALIASQESAAIATLLSRFAGREKMSDLGNATLLELVYTHRDKLLQALSEEQLLLRDVMPALHMDDPKNIQSGDPVSLANAAERNLALCEELTLGSDKASRKADSIIPELVTSMADLRLAARQTQIGMTRIETEADKK